MNLRIDTTDRGQTAAALALLDSLDDSTFVSLGVLFGTDLCVLGGTRHPTCWEALKGAWNQLEQKKREQLAQTSTLAMRDRDLLVEPPLGAGVAALLNPASLTTSAVTPGTVVSFWR